MNCDKNNEGFQGLKIIQDSYYAMAVKISGMTNTRGRADNNAERASSPTGRSNFVERQKLLKLPFANLPEYHGDYKTWLSFAHSFRSMVDANARYR